MRDLVRYLADVLRLGSFLIFLFLGFSLLHRREPRARRKRINLLLFYMLAVNLVVGVSQRDDWPFSPYPLMRGVWNGAWQYQKLTPVGVDARGREWDLDPRSWAPVFPLVLQEWFNVIYPTLGTRGQTEAVRFLLARAEAARKAASSGSRWGNDRILGPLTAPDWWLYRKIDAISPTPYVAIRFYRESWRPLERMADPSKFHRDLIAEYAQAH